MSRLDPIAHCAIKSSNRYNGNQKMTILGSVQNNKSDTFLDKVNVFLNIYYSINSIYSTQYVSQAKKAIEEWSEEGPNAERMMYIVFGKVVIPCWIAFLNNPVLSKTITGKKLLQEMRQASLESIIARNDYEIDNFFEYVGKNFADLVGHKNLIDYMAASKKLTKYILSSTLFLEKLDHEDIEEFCFRYRSKPENLSALLESLDKMGRWSLSARKYILLYQNTSWSRNIKDSRELDFGKAEIKSREHLVAPIARHSGIIETMEQSALQDEQQNNRRRSLTPA